MKIKIFGLTLKQLISILLKRKGRNQFLWSLPEASKILDVGCGNNGPKIAKSIVKNCNYVGIDIGDYNQNSSQLADKYILTSPDDFANRINKIEDDFDAVISNHNLEHCNDREGVLNAMCGRLKVSGKIYLCFPSEKTVSFPHGRNGTLNYYDDSTHLDIPPTVSWVSERLKANGLRINFVKKSYKPFLLWFIGGLLEPIFKITKRVGPETWAFYGFEAIIIAEKI
jgi:SAM-dependent methyltransferase